MIQERVVYAEMGLVCLRIYRDGCNMNREGVKSREGTMCTAEKGAVHTVETCYLFYLPGAVFSLFLFNIERNLTKAIFTTMHFVCCRSPSP